jgi:hypothetical protein
MTSITTDIANLCLFDLECLQHRKDDMGHDRLSIGIGLKKLIMATSFICDFGSSGTYGIFSVEEIFLKAANIISGRFQEKHI